MKCKIVEVLIIALCITLVIVFMNISFENRPMIRLQYEKVSFIGTMLPVIYMPHISSVVDTHSIDGIVQTFYTSDRDEGNKTHSYITVNGQHYYLGETLGNDTYSFHLTPSSITNTMQIYEWNEAVGANYTRTRFLVLQDGYPYLIAEMDGHTIHHDIDEDGEMETIATVGTVADTTLYEWDFANQRYSLVNLNNVVGVYYLRYDEEHNWFETVIDGEEYYYLYKNNALYLK